MQYYVKFAATDRNLLMKDVTKVPWLWKTNKRTMIKSVVRDNYNICIFLILAWVMMSWCLQWTKDIWQQKSPSEFSPVFLKLNININAYLYNPFTKCQRCGAFMFIFVFMNNLLEITIAVILEATPLARSHCSDSNHDADTSQISK